MPTWQPAWQSRILGSNWRNLARSGAHLVVQEEVKRESLGAILYGPDEHKLNPYIGGNLQAINEFIKRDSNWPRSTNRKPNQFRFRSSARIAI